jgi:hypothetical protein
LRSTSASGFGGISRAAVLVLLASSLLAQSPALVFPGELPDAVRTEAARRGWKLLTPSLGTPLKEIEALVRNSGADPDRVYLAGEGSSAWSVAFAVSRIPDLWAAGVMFGGEPRAAIETNRLFSVNTSMVPLLWVSDGTLKPPSELSSVEVRQVDLPEVFEWLAGKSRKPYPPKVDCETGSLQFARCYWAEITKLDPTMRNAVLPLTRLQPGSGAHLALGAFGYRVTDPGPGVLVGYLSEGYQGPLKLNDRIVAVGGKPIQDARQYRELMDQLTDERPTSAMVLRGKERTRIETRIVLPKREELTTGRIQAEFLLDAREVMVITRGVGGFRLHLPPQWIPARITWNGDDLGEAGTAGCWRAETGAKALRCEE